MPEPGSQSKCVTMRASTSFSSGWLSGQQEPARRGPAIDGAPDGVPYRRHALPFVHQQGRCSAEHVGRIGIGDGSLRGVVQAIDRACPALVGRFGLADALRALERDRRKFRISSSSSLSTRRDRHSLIVLRLRSAMPSKKRTPFQFDHHDATVSPLGTLPFRHRAGATGRAGQLRADRARIFCNSCRAFRLPLLKDVVKMASGREVGACAADLPAGTLLRSSTRQVLKEQPRARASFQLEACRQQG